MARDAVSAMWAHHRMILAGVLLMIGALVPLACLSVPEARYYTLDMNPSGKVETDLHVQVGRIHASDALARSELLIQASPTRVEYYAVDQWASDLSQMVQEKLQVEFGPAEIPQYRLEGDLLGFEQIDTDGGADARVKLRLRVYDAQERRSADPVLRRTYEETTPATAAGPDEVVAALSDALESVAVQIANDLATLSAN